jgi:hypothetical protein
VLTLSSKNSLAFDHLVEQMMPVDTWGKDFFTISTPDRTVGDYFKIVASEDNTEISLGGTVHSTINAREFLLLNVNTGDYRTLTADKAVMDWHHLFYKMVRTRTGHGILYSYLFSSGENVYWVVGYEPSSSKVTGTLITVECLISVKGNLKCIAIGVSASAI